MEKLINKTITKGTQEVTYTELFEMNGKKLKLVIKSDSFDFQCYAKVMVLKQDEGWFNLCDIHYSNMKTPDQLYYKYNRDEKPSIEDEKYFAEDIKALKELAKQLLN